MINDSNRYRGGRVPRTLVRLTIQDLADFFGVTKRTIHRWISSGLLPLTGNPIQDLELILDRKQNQNRPR